MPTLHVFNPSHDEALAAATPYYTPTQAAQQLAMAYAALPSAWAAAGDAYLCADGKVCHVGENAPFTPEARFWDGVTSVAPWGWDAHVAHRLRRLGAPERLLPTAAQIAQIRALSSRATAIRLLPLVRRDVREATVGQSAWCASAAEVWDTVAAFGGKAMLKAPWSCSGRGVFSVTSADAQSAATTGRIVRVLQRQGGVAVEPLYERLQDFAMEFRADGDGAVRYVGLSLFRTSPTGDYAGNLVAHDAVLLSLLPVSLRPVVEAICERLLRRLGEAIAGDYVGPLGVDMMVVRSLDGTLAVHPCVELNLRHTMGHVAIAMRRYLPTPESRALFVLNGAGQRPQDFLKVDFGKLQ